MALVVGRRGQADEPPLPVPRGLRPFLRFTRLPDRALTATRRVLDDDDEFRSAVRDATSEDAVGRAGWLFLDRPGGWEEELAELAAAAAEAAGEARGARSERETARRLAAADESLGRAEAELARRVAELAEVKQQLAVERRARRRGESETGRLHKRVAGLEAELEEGRHQAADGRDLVAELHHLRQRCAELEAERRRAQEQVHQLERDHATGGGDGSGGAPPSGAVPSGSGPPGDRVAEVEALVDAVTATVSTLADALATAVRQLAPFTPSAPPIITAPTPGPARAAAPSARASAAPSRPAPQPAELPPGVWEDSAEAADHLVRMQGVLVLVDGYNVTKLARPELSLSEQRRWLADAAAELAARTGARLELVFDGVGHGVSAPADRDRRARVQVRYSPDGVEADDVVIDLVSELAGDRPVVVASDDRRVQEGSRRGGANVMTASQLLAVLRRR
ncbi:MAG TPA: NYN domain-containing protein [Acidimicrobiales bacterium]|nr:NYN domain-containing protein [Acidimicrobiales bacterium]